MTKAKNFTATFLFALLLLPSLYLVNRFNHQKGSTSHQAHIDGFLIKASATEYDKSGKPNATSHSTRVVYYRKNNSALFNNPHISGHSRDGTPWRLQAKYGKTQDGNKQLRFWNRVTLQQLPTENSPETTLETKSITASPNQSRAITHKSVTLKRPGITAHGKGAIANFKTGIVRLLSHSEGDLAPTGPKAHSHSTVTKKQHGNTSHKITD